jgi:hypothetical protein
VNDLIGAFPRRMEGLASERHLSPDPLVRKVSGDSGQGALRAEAFPVEFQNSDRQISLVCLHAKAHPVARDLIKDPLAYLQIVAVELLHCLPRV